MINSLLKNILICICFGIMRSYFSKCWASSNVSSRLIRKKSCCNLNLLIIGVGECFSIVFPLIDFWCSFFVQVLIGDFFLIWEKDLHINSVDFFALRSTTIMMGLFTLYFCIVKSNLFLCTLYLGGVIDKIFFIPNCIISICIYSCVYLDL